MKNPVQITIITTLILTLAIPSSAQSTQTLRQSSPTPAPDATQTTQPSSNLQTTPTLTPQPTPEPTPEPTPAPTPEPTPEPTPALTPAPTPEQTPEPAPEPAPEVTPAPDQANTTSTETTTRSTIEFPLTPPAIPHTDAPAQTLLGGLTYQTLRPGTGPETQTTSTRRIHYTLWLEDGTFVESSRHKPLPRPFEFTPTYGQAIPGMEQATQNMKVGEIRKVHIPARLAYGSQARKNIPANSNLIFVVELVDIIQPRQTTP